MNSENIRKWIEALRSGEYKQTIGALRDKHGYCCLGVACDLAVKNEVPLYIEVEDDGIYTYDRNSGNLPELVQDWLGIPYPNPVIRDMSLAKHNDNGDSFAFIADLIESTYLGEK